MGRFPVTDRNEPRPTDPANEPTREYVNAHPEGLTERILRARRYFRFCRRAPPQQYARGLETDQDDFA